MKSNDKIPLNDINVITEEKNYEKDIKIKKNTIVVENMSAKWTPVWI